MSVDHFCACGQPRRISWDCRWESEIIMGHADASAPVKVSVDGCMAWPPTNATTSPEVVLNTSKNRKSVIANPRKQVTHPVSARERRQDKKPEDAVGLTAFVTALQHCTCNSRLALGVWQTPPVVTQLGVSGRETRVPQKSFNSSCEGRMGALRFFAIAIANRGAYIRVVAALQHRFSEFRVQCPKEGLVPNESYVSQT